MDNNHVYNSPGEQPNFWIIITTVDYDRYIAVVTTRTNNRCIAMVATGANDYKKIKNKLILVKKLTGDKLRIYDILCY